MMQQTNARSIGVETSLRLLAAPLAALLLGLFLVVGAGFSPISVVHNAAHDSRHSFAFPCH
jgi:cobalt transporter subunit CbtB